MILDPTQWLDPARQHTVFQTDLSGGARVAFHPLRVRSKLTDDRTLLPVFFSFQTRRRDQHPIADLESLHLGICSN